MRHILSPQLWEKAFEENGISLVKSNDDFLRGSIGISIEVNTYEGLGSTRLLDSESLTVSLGQLLSVYKPLRIHQEDGGYYFIPPLLDKTMYSNSVIPFIIELPYSSHRQLSPSSINKQLRLLVTPNLPIGWEKLGDTIVVNRYRLVPQPSQKQDKVVGFGFVLKNAPGRIEALYLFKVGNMWNFQDFGVLFDPRVNGIVPNFFATGFEYSELQNVIEPLVRYLQVYGIKLGASSYRLDESYFMIRRGIDPLKWVILDFKKSVKYGTNRKAARTFDIYWDRTIKIGEIEIWDRLQSIDLYDPELIVANSSGHVSIPLGSFLVSLKLTKAISFKFDIGTLHNHNLLSYASATPTIDRIREAIATSLTRGHKFVSWKTVLNTLQTTQGMSQKTKAITFVMSIVYPIIKALNGWFNGKLLENVVFHYMLGMSQGNVGGSIEIILGEATPMGIGYIDSIDENLLNLARQTALQLASRHNQPHQRAAGIPVPSTCLQQMSTKLSQFKSMYNLTNASNDEILFEIFREYVQSSDKLSDECLNILPIVCEQLGIGYCWDGCEACVHTSFWDFPMGLTRGEQLAYVSRRCTVKALPHIDFRRTQE